MIRNEQAKRDKKIIDLYLGGETSRMLAARFGLSTQQINNILNRGIAKRKKDLTNKIRRAILSA